MAAKHKISQNDLRKFMSQHKQKKLETGKKIESPLAKYLSDGTIKCILCDSGVRNEALWNVHINAKVHKENIARKKQGVVSVSVDPPVSRVLPVSGSIEDLNDNKVLIKRPSEHEYPPPKKLKSILKNSTARPEQNQELSTNDETQPVQNHVKNIEMETDSIEPTPVAGTSNVQIVVPPNDLPEGFFDNPLLDAKARNVEYKDPIEEEWERFQKEMKEEVSLSTRLMEDESEVATVERQIVEVDEQMKNWSRVVDMEKKKENLDTKLTTQLQVKKEEGSDSSSEEDLDEFVHWRNKKSFR